MFYDNMYIYIYIYISKYNKSINTSIYLNVILVQDAIIQNTWSAQTHQVGLIIVYIHVLVCHGITSRQSSSLFSSLLPSVCLSSLCLSVRPSLTCVTPCQSYSYIYTRDCHIDELCPGPLMSHSSFTECPVLHPESSMYSNDDVYTLREGNSLSLYDYRQGLFFLSS